MACNARFASLKGFFDAELANDDMMTPLQREFIGLAQIFKASLVTEMEYRQRVMERAVIEERLGSREEDLREAREAERIAKDQFVEASNSMRATSGTHARRDIRSDRNDDYPGQQSRVRQSISGGHHGIRSARAGHLDHGGHEWSEGAGRRIRRVGRRSAGRAVAQHKVSPVPPEHEIQVLDPGVDPLGIPAAVLRERGNGLEVDIPPTVLVHKYYYTGDRTFQAQLLPGGPTIVVANHPKTSERLYIDVQMLPGAPVVTYSGRTIEYDYGDNAIAIHFGLFGHVQVKYRNGASIREEVAVLIHAEQLKSCAGTIVRHAKGLATKSKTAVAGTALIVKDKADQVVLPVKNLLQMGPLGNLGQTLQTRVAEHRAAPPKSRPADGWRKMIY